MKFGQWMARSATATLLGVGLAACGGGGGDDTPSATPAPAPAPAQVSFDAKPVIDNVADNIITATYVSLNNQAVVLLATVEALDDGDATEADMDAAQTAWRAARKPWEASEGFIFGPVDSLGIDPAIDSWPLNTADLSAFLTINPDPGQVDIENAADEQRGFHAIEFLLFGDGVADNQKTAAELMPAEINYLVALVQAFGSRTAQLANAWTTDFNGRGPYATLLKTAGPANASYSSQAAVIEELINGVTGIVDEVGAAKISEPNGNSIGTADTSKVESQYSWNSLSDFSDNIQSVLNVYTGKLGFQQGADSVSVSQNGLYALVVAHDGALATRVLNEILDAQHKIALIKGDGDRSTTTITGAAQPFRQQILTPTGRALIQAAIDALATLKMSLERDVLPLTRSTTFRG